MRITILGAGAWGTAMATSLCDQHEIALWARDADALRHISQAGENTKYLPGVLVPAAIRMEGDLIKATSHAQLIIVATALAGLRPLLQGLGATRTSVPVLWLCKGFERDTSMLPHQIAEQELPGSMTYGALSGPSFAKDVARGLPAALTLATASEATAQTLAGALNGPRLRIYSSDDLTGVEVGGALKNVIAIAAGICDGLGLGESARAALITRGLAEITRLGLGLGGKLETFLGLSCVGDLVLTCTSDQSRNRRVGLALAQDQNLAQILAGLGHVAEGVFTAGEALKLAQRLGLEAPIVATVCQVLAGTLKPRDALAELMRREPKRDTP